MREPPPLSKLPQFPVVGGIGLLSLAVTLADQTKVLDVSPLVENPSIRDGQVWRLVTSILPHGDFLHLAFNLFWLWVLGSVVEAVFGHARAAGIILLLAVGSSAPEYALMHGGVGLSGVGYGLFGMLWVLSGRDERFRGAVDSQTAAFFVGWFFLCIILTAAGVMAVANIAHGAGAVLGALLGLAVSGGRLRVLYAGVLALLLLACGAAVYARPYVNLDRKERAWEWARVGYEDFEHGRHESAVRHYGRAVAADPGNPEMWFSLGAVRHALEDYAGALESYRKAEQLDPAAEKYRDTRRDVERYLKELETYEAGQKPGRVPGAP